MAWHVTDIGAFRSRAKEAKDRGEVSGLINIDEYINMLDEIDRLREDLQATKLRADANAAMLKAAESHNARAKDGWQLVPYWPTVEMLDAWDAAPKSECDTENLMKGYRAMLDAAPKAEASA